MSDEWIFKIGDSHYKFNESSRELKDADGQQIKLSERPESLLLHFLNNPVACFTKDELTSVVWGKPIGDGSIDKVIGTVRNALKDKGGKFSIKNEHGKGYRFVGEISQTPIRSVLKFNKNGARMLQEVVSLHAYRSPYSSSESKADLYCEVIFSKGNIGGEPESSPVRFKLSLKRAQLIINGDEADILKLVPRTVRESNAFKPRSLVVQKKHTGVSAAIYEFFPCTTTKHLEGEMSTDSLSKRILCVRDSRSVKTLEPPELLVQVRCRRENIDIHDIHFPNDKNSENWENASEEKRLLVKQTLRDEFLKHYLVMGNLDDTHSSFIFAESITFEESDV